MSRKEERDSRLDALDTAVTEWGDKEMERLDNEVEFLNSVLGSRTGAGRLASQNQEDSSRLLVNKIQEFLE